MTYSCLLALVFTVSCFAPSTEVLSLPNETYVYPAAVFNATQQICSQETLRQEIINGIKQDSYRYIQDFLSKSCAMIACYLLHGIYCTDISTPVFKHNRSSSHAATISSNLQNPGTKNVCGCVSLSFWQNFCRVLVTLRLCISLV